MAKARRSAERVGGQGSVRSSGSGVRKMRWAFGDGGGGEGAGVGAAVVVAGDAVGGGGPVDCLVAQVETAGGAVAQLGHPAHQAVHPEAEVGDGEVDLL